MRTNVFKRNTILTLIALCLIVCGVAMAFGTAGLNSPMTVYAMEAEDTDGCEGMEEIDREVD